LKEFVSLETRKRELDSELKAIAARIDDLEQALVPQFLTDGVASMKVDGRTVYIAQDIQAAQNPVARTSRSTMWSTWHTILVSAA
jgi:hypothetical protein